MLAPLQNWLANAPLWEIGVAVFGGLVATWLAGAALRRRHDRSAALKDGAADPGDGEQGILVSAVLGLLALLIAFTFSIVIDRFDTRRVNVLNEANAIGTTYLRAQLLEQPHRARLSRQLVQYTDIRIALAGKSRGPEQTALLAMNDKLLADLWTSTVAAFPSMRPYPLSGSFLETMNNLIDMDATRKAGRQARVPSEVLLVLFLYQFVAAGVIRYGLSGRAGRRMGPILVFLLGSLTLVIIDIDKPVTGGISESQEPMLQLRAFLRAQPPESFDPLPGHEQAIGPS